MRLTHLVRIAACLALVGVGAASPGCGGTSGGGGGGCTIPGVLAAVALQGDTTPAGGVYGAFPATTPISVAPLGWTAFVADVVGGTTNRGLFVVRPNGAVVLVYARGETVPNTNGGTGTIDVFERIWMRPNGIVVALVTISSGSGEGFVTARVDDSNGAVVEKAGAAYFGITLPKATGSATPGTLTAIDGELTQVDDQGSVFFVGVGSGATPLHGIWTVSRSGNQIAAVTVSGDAAPVTGTIGFNFDGLGIDGDGVVAAFAVDVIAGPSQALFVGYGGGLARVAADGDVPPNVGGLAFQQVYASGPIVVSFGGGATQAFVTWRGEVTGAAPDHGIFTRQVVNGGAISLGSLQTMLSPGQTVSGTGGGLLFDADLVEAQDDPARITIDVAVSGGATDRLFLSAPDPATLIPLMGDGMTAPGSTATFGTAYPSLGVGFGDAADRLGDFAFSAVLSDSSSGVYWGVIGCSLGLVAAEGTTAPGVGAGAFGSFATPSTVTATATAIAFRAALVGGTAGSGLFRQL